MIFRAVALSLLLVFPMSVRAEKRAAFVVGIDKYDNLGALHQLQRAVSDAHSMSATLSSLGFYVLELHDVGRSAFNAQWQKFLDKLGSSDAAVIYFSGHGVDIEGANFLLPRDVPNITYGRQDQLRRESLSVSELLLDLRQRKPQVALIILDACRDNPFLPSENRSISGPRGLARMDAPGGTFIMYSAGAGESALDRLPGTDPDNVNSVYTRRLIPLVKKPGLPLHELARQLRQEVHDLAASVGQVQQPAYYDGVIGKFCLAGCQPPTGVPQKPAPARSHGPLVSVTSGTPNTASVPASATNQSKKAPRGLEYAGLQIGMRREEVRYLKGYPPLALQFPTEGPYNDRSDYKTWVYPVGDDPNTELTVTFNDDKTALIKISCTSHVAANQTVPSPVKQCPPLAGIVDGDSEKDVLDRLGPPDDVRFGAGAKLMAYQTRGLFFYLQRQQVYIMELSATK